MPITTLKMITGHVVGFMHTRDGTNNQDYISPIADIANFGTYSVVVFSDGCGSCPNSEVGAFLWTNLVQARVCNELLSGSEPTEKLFVDAISSASKMLNDTLLSQMVANPSEFLLATCNILVIDHDEQEVIITYVGDSFLNVDGKTLSKRAVDNTPMYPQYFANYDSGRKDLEDEVANNLIRQKIKGIDDYLYFGTDGAGDLYEFLEDSGTLEQELEAASNKDSLIPLLRKYNKLGQRIDWEKQTVQKAAGPLYDDTTLVLLKV